MSDYCVQPDGQVVFFEVEGFNPKTLRQAITHDLPTHVLDESLTTDNATALLPLLKRYQGLGFNGLPSNFNFLKKAA